MKTLVYTIIVGLLLLNMVSGQSTTVIEQLREASKIANDSIRLYTYDKILENQGIKEKVLEEKKKPVDEVDSKWMVTTDINPLDDSKRYFH
jgi:hypothetical protein